MNATMVEWMNGLGNECLHGCKDGRRNADGCIDELMGKQIIQERMNG